MKFLMLLFVGVSAFGQSSVTVKLKDCIPGPGVKRVKEDRL